MRDVTLLFLLKDDQILLAMKKRRFGAGKWNGVGGKVDYGETILQAAVRECEEEIGVTPINPKLLGKIEFHDEKILPEGHLMHIFAATEWKGDPKETEEMRPLWFNVKQIPYGEMWADDPLWLPLLLSGTKFESIMTLDGDRIVSHTIKTVEDLT